MFSSLSKTLITLSLFSPFPNMFSIPYQRQKIIPKNIFFLRVLLTITLFSSHNVFYPQKDRNSSNSNFFLSFTISFSLVRYKNFITGKVLTILKTLAKKPFKTIIDKNANTQHFLHSPQCFLPFP